MERGIRIKIFKFDAKTEDCNEQYNAIYTPTKWKG